MQNVPGEVEHCLGRNSRDNLKEEGVSPLVYLSILTEYRLARDKDLPLVLEQIQHLVPAQ